MSVFDVRRVRPRAIALGTSVALVAGLLPGIAQVVVAAPPALVFVGAVPTYSPAGNTFTVTVGATSDGTTVDPARTASVTFTSSDPGATVSPTTPRTITGSQQFSITLPTKPAPGTTISRTIEFSAATYAAATATITVTTAAKLAFVTQPGSGSPGYALGVQPRIAVQDAYGNTVQDATNGISLSLLPPSTVSGTYPGGSLASCSGSRAAGVTTYANCAVTAVGREYRIAATSGDLTGVTSAPFDVSARLAFEPGLPSKVTVGVTTLNPQVSVNWTTSGATSVFTRSLSDNSTVVTLAIKPGTGAAGAKLVCDQANNALRVTSGLAAFTNCRIDRIATGYKLVATASPVMTATESSSIEVAGGAASKLTFTQEPTTGTAGVPFSRQPVVAITDAGGNVVRTAAASVFLSIASRTGIGTLTCDPAVVATTSNGVATFAGCSISAPGVYTLLATPANPTCSPLVPCALAAATSSAFTLTVKGATVTLRPSATTVTYGQKVTLTTTIAPNGANRAFAIQRSLDGAAWLDWVSLTTGSTGARAYTFTPTFTFSYRAYFPGASDLTGGVSAVTRVAVRERIVMSPHSATTRTVALGRTLMWSATVRPKASPAGKPYARFYVWKRASTGWKLVTAKSVTVDETGVARFSYRFGSRGTYRVRSLAGYYSTYNSPSLPSPWEDVRVP